MITLKVYLNREALSTDHRVLERRINWDPSLHFPLEEILKSMRVLFGSEAIVLTIFE